MGDTLGLYGAKLAEEDPELYQSLQSRQARQQIANMLMQRGIQPRQGHMAGKFYVAPSWSQGLADMVQAGLGAWLTKHNIDESDLQAKAIQERKVRDRKEMESDFGPVPAVPGKEAVEGVAPTVEGGNLDEVLGATPPLPAQEALPSVRPMGQDPRGLVAKALLSQRGVAPSAAPQPHPITGIPQPAFGPQNPAPVPLPDIASEPAFNQMMQESPGFKDRNPDFTYEQALKSPHWYEPGGPVPTSPPPGPPQYQMPQVTNPGVEAQPAIAPVPGRERTPQEIEKATLRWMSSSDPSMREAAKFLAQQRTAHEEKNVQRDFLREENRYKIDAKLESDKNRIDMMVGLKLMTMEEGAKAKADADARHADLMKSLNASTTSTQRDIAKGHDETNLAIAGMKGSGKQEKALEDKQLGLQNVQTLTAQLKDYYSQLKEHGGITSTEEGALGNIGASIGSSGVGQAVGGALGTKNQSIRDSISQQRPLLLQAIMKATGMTAKQMDSNAELKLWLSVATDPQKGYEANMRALDMILKLYGAEAHGTNGAGGAARSSPAPSSQPGWSIELGK